MKSCQDGGTCSCSAPDGTSSTRQSQQEAHWVCSTSLDLSSLFILLILPSTNYHPHHRWTEIQTPVVPGKTTLGLHSLGLKIHRVLVNSEPAEFSVREYPRPSLSASNSTSLKDVAEHAHFDYLAAVRAHKSPAGSLGIHAVLAFMAPLRTASSSRSSDAILDTPRAVVACSSACQ